MIHMVTTSPLSHTHSNYAAVQLILHIILLAYGRACTLRRARSVAPIAIKNITIVDHDLSSEVNELNPAGINYRLIA